MSLADIPATFVCDLCAVRQDRALVCWTVLQAAQVACLRCCGCPEHQYEDPGGVAVFTAQAGTLIWRGLDGAAARTRRHP